MLDRVRLLEALDDPGPGAGSKNARPGQSPSARGRKRSGASSGQQRGRAGSPEKGGVDGNPTLAAEVWAAGNARRGRSAAPFYGL